MRVAREHLVHIPEVLLLITRVLHGINSVDCVVTFLETFGELMLILEYCCTKWLAAIGVFVLWWF